MWLTFALGTILLVCANLVAAQAGGPAMAGGSTLPGGVVQRDALKDFHRTLAVQATTHQIAEFQNVVGATDLALGKLKPLVQGSTPVNRTGLASFDQALQDALSASKKFQAGLSEPQASGLREIVRRLEKANSDLEQEARRFDQTVVSEAATAEISAHADALDKALAEFSNAQLAVGREMSIVLATGQDLRFNLPSVRNPVTIGARTIVVGVSGSLSQTRSEGGLRTFGLAMAGNLVDLQHSITELMNAELDERKSCGERLSVRQATIMPAAPASNLVLQLHYERWLCAGSFGQSISTELAEGNGTVEIRLTPAVGKSNVISLAADFNRIDAHGMMGEALRSGDLGSDLREKAVNLLSSALQACADFNKTLPQSVQGGATLQSVRFQEVGAGGLSVVLEGQVQASNEQVNVLAKQLNQTLSAQGNPAQ